MADWSCAAPAPRQGVLYDLSACNFCVGCIKFYLVRSNSNALLVHGHQRRSGSTSDGYDDAFDRRCKGHGPIYDRRRPTFCGMAGDDRHGRRRDWDVHYCRPLAKYLVNLQFLLKLENSTMYFVALATDYDGTIAEDGIVAEATREALCDLKRSGRKLLLVTGISSQT